VGAVPRIPLQRSNLGAAPHVALARVPEVTAEQGQGERVAAKFGRRGSQLRLVRIVVVQQRCKELSSGRLVELLQFEEVGSASGLQKVCDRQPRRDQAETVVVRGQLTEQSAQPLVLQPTLVAVGIRGRIL
jgi:hypothetical protein